MFSTKPASSPPSTTRPQLILPIVTSGRETDANTPPPPLRADATAVKQSPHGTTSNATIPPSPSGTVATPLGTTQSDPSTCRLKWYNPRRSTNAPSQTSSPKGRSRTGCQAFQSPAMATERASGIRNRTTRLSPRGSGTRGVHWGTAATSGGPGGPGDRTPRGTHPAPRGALYRPRCGPPPPSPP